MKDNDFFSLRMRASKGGPHELGGKHISGGENLCTKDEIPKKSLMLMKKALTHKRGEPDFLQIIIEKISEPITFVKPLSVRRYEVKDANEGQQKARLLLKAAGIEENIVDRGFLELSNSWDTRGAIIIDVNTGMRIDGRGLKGVRVSRVDWEEDSYERWLTKHCQPRNPRMKDALAIATKVSSHPSTVAELCWSDDPDYITGYVASQKNGYERITKMKEYGDEKGGRVFFVNLASKQEIEQYIHYLEKVPVMLKMED
jgi:6-carboxyhexanoate--CoA ligase